MNWTDMFPVLDEAMLREFALNVSDDERLELEHWLKVSEIFPGRPTTTSTVAASQSHVVSTTVFWKHVGAKDPELPIPSRERLLDSRRLGLVKRFDVWETYIEPLLSLGPEQMANHQDIVFRVYLAKDLDFLLDDFLFAGWEVYLMENSSIRYCPGGFWRFLALEDDGLVTVVDADRIALVHTEITRTRAMSDMGLGLWRVPGYYNQEPTKEVRYRPMLGGHFGAKGGIPSRLLITAYIWHARRGSLPLSVRVPGVGHRPLMFSEWPGYGYDEIFQLVALYPWLVSSGTLTFIPPDARSLFLPADLEYATQANPRSEAIYLDEKQMGL